MSHRQHGKDKKASPKQKPHQPRTAIETTELQDIVDWSTILPLSHENCAPVCDEFVSQLDGVTSEGLARKIIGAIFKPKKKLGKCPVCQSEDRCGYVCDEYKDHVLPKKRNREAAPPSVEFNEVDNPVTTPRIQVIHKRKQCKRSKLCTYCLDGLKCIHKSKRRDKKVCKVLRRRSTDKHCTLNDQFPSSADDASVKRLRISTDTLNVIPIIKEEYQEKTTKSVFRPRRLNKEDVLFKKRRRNDEIFKHYTNFESFNYVTADDEEDMDDDKFFEMLVNMSSDSDLDLCGACSSGARCEDVCPNGKPTVKKKRHTKTKSVLSDERKFRKRVNTDQVHRDYSKEKVLIQPQMAKSIADDFLTAFSSSRNEDSCEPICKEFRRRLNKLTQQNQGTKYKNLKLWDNTENFSYTHEGKPYWKKLTSPDLFRRNSFRKGDRSDSPHQLVSERRVKPVDVIEPKEIRKYEIGKGETNSKEKAHLLSGNEKPRDLNYPLSSNIKLFHAEVRDGDDFNTQHYVYEKSPDLTLERQVSSPPSSSSEFSNESSARDRRLSQRERVGESSEGWRRQYWKRNTAQTKDFQGYTMEPMYDTRRISDENEDDSWLHEPTQEVIAEPKRESSQRSTKISFNENVAQYDTNPTDESVQTDSLAGSSSSYVRDRNTDHSRESSLELDHRYSEDVKVMRRRSGDSPTSSRRPSSALELVIPEGGNREQPQYFFSNPDNQEASHTMTATESVMPIKKISSNMEHARGERNKYLNYYKYSIFENDHPMEENKKTGNESVDTFDFGTQSEDVPPFTDEKVLNTVDGLEINDSLRINHTRPTQSNRFNDDMLGGLTAESVEVGTWNKVDTKNATTSIATGTSQPSLITISSDDVEFKNTKDMTKPVTKEDAITSSLSQPTPHSILNLSTEISKTFSTDLAKNCLKEATNKNTLFNALETKDAYSQTQPSDYGETMDVNTIQSSKFDNRNKNVRIVDMNKPEMKLLNTYNNPELPLNSTLTRVDDVKLSDSDQLHLPAYQRSSIQSLASLSDDSTIDLKGSIASTNIQSQISDSNRMEEVKSDKATTHTDSGDIIKQYQFPFQTVLTKPSPADSVNESTDVKNTDGSDSYSITYDSSTIIQITPPGFSDMDVHPPSARFSLEEDDINSLLDFTISDNQSNQLQRSVAANTDDAQININNLSLPTLAKEGIVPAPNENVMSSNKNETKRSIAVNTETTATEVDNAVTYERIYDSRTSVEIHPPSSWTFLKDGNAGTADHKSRTSEARHSIVVNNETETDQTSIKIEPPRSVSIKREVTKIETNNATTRGQMDDDDSRSLTIEQNTSPFFNSTDFTMPNSFREQEPTLTQQMNDLKVSKRPHVFYKLTNNEEGLETNSLKPGVFYSNSGSSTHPSSNVEQAAEMLRLDSIAFCDHDVVCETTDACQRFCMQAFDGNKGTQTVGKSRNTEFTPKCCASKRRRNNLLDETEEAKVTQKKKNYNHQPQPKPNSCQQRQSIPYFINLLNCPQCTTANNLNPTEIKPAETPDSYKEEIRQADIPIEIICTGCCEQGQQTEKAKHRHRQINGNFDQTFIVNVLHTTKIFNNAAILNNYGLKKEDGLDSKAEGSSLISNNSGIPINLKKNTLCMLDDLQVNNNFKPRNESSETIKQDSLKQYLTTQVNFIKHQVECNTQKNQSKTYMRQPIHSAFQQNYEVYTVTTQQDVERSPTKETIRTQLASLCMDCKNPGICMKTCETLKNLLKTEGATKELNSLSSQINSKLPLKYGINQKDTSTQKNMPAAKKDQRSFKNFNQQNTETYAPPTVEQTTESLKPKGVCDQCENPFSCGHACDSWKAFQRQLNNKNKHDPETANNQQKLEPIEENAPVSSGTQNNLNDNPDNPFKSQQPIGVCDHCENPSSCGKACDTWKAFQRKFKVPNWQKGVENTQKNQESQSTSDGKSPFVNQKPAAICDTCENSSSCGKLCEERRALQINLNNSNRQQEQETSTPFPENQILQTKLNNVNQQQNQETSEKENTTVSSTIQQIPQDNQSPTSTSSSFSDELKSTDITQGILKPSHDDNAMEGKSFKSVDTMTKEINSLLPILVADQSESTLNANSIRDSIVLNEVNLEKRASQKLTEDDDNPPPSQTGSVHWNNQPEVLIESPIDNVRVSNSITLYQQIDGRRVGNQSIDSGDIGDSRQRTVSIVVDATPEEETKMFSDIVSKPEDAVVNNEHGSNESLKDQSQESTKTEATQISLSQFYTLAETKDNKTANVVEVEGSVTFEVNAAPNKFEAVVESEMQSTPMQCEQELLDRYQQSEIPQMQMKKRLKVECFFVGQCPLCKNKIVCKPNYEDFREYITEGYDKKYLTGESYKTISNYPDETKGFKDTSNSKSKKQNKKTFSGSTLDMPPSTISENYSSNIKSTKDTINTASRRKHKKTFSGSTLDMPTSTTENYASTIDTDIVTSNSTFKAKPNKILSASTLAMPGSKTQKIFSELDSSNTAGDRNENNLKMCPQCRCDAGCNPICHAAKKSDVETKICQTCTCETFLCNPLCLALKSFKESKRD